MDDRIRELFAELTDYVVSFEGIHERHRQFLLGFFREKAEQFGIREVDAERTELLAALKKATRTANQRNITAKERRMMIRDTLTPYLKNSVDNGK